MKRICVNCGSSPGLLKEYAQAASELGKLLAQNDIELVFGGADAGLMGKIADAVLNNGGKVTGVIPKKIADKVGHIGLTELRIVNSMHERKQTMFDLSDAFIALPGGIGTLEEIFEIMTWSQLGIHEKPFGLLNTSGYYDKLMEYLKYSVSQRFVREEHLSALAISDSPSDLLKQLYDYKSVKVDKWIDRNSK
ncbi:MAG: Rossman fold protein, TIGR00730 family [Candidatus Firestonebacteria bacterium GWA2_43_8]|nr:MAG: Rossman fold protein, TIGR00730 family [Candidatus Firestonebacteria bacterium GWA2_43_8]